MIHKKSFYFFISMVFVIVLQGCEKKPEELPTHNKALFDKGRYCSDYLKFGCLPESRDATLLAFVANEENYYLTPKEEERYKIFEYKTLNEVNWGRYDINTSNIPKDKIENVRANYTNTETKRIKELLQKDKTMANYVLQKEDFEWIAKVRLKQWYYEMEATLEEEYPGFWGDIPRKTRHRWMRLCVAKGHKYGYGLQEELYNEKGEKFDPERALNDRTHDIFDFNVVKHILDKNGNPLPVVSEVREMQQWIELCARIGLYFDNDPKWDYIVEFLKRPESSQEGYAGEAVTYLDFTVYDKNTTPRGDQITSWMLKTSLRLLPYPNRPVPRLND